MKKKKIIITGGAGFIGTNLIKLLLKKTKYKIVSIDNYSSGFKKNHVKNKNVSYIKSDTKNITQILKYPNQINSIFHFNYRKIIAITYISGFFKYIDYTFCRTMPYLDCLKIDFIFRSA